MLVADGDGVAGDGHIQAFGGQLCLQGGGVDGRFPLLQPLLDGGADGVGGLAHGGALLGGELAHQLQDGGQLALFAQPFDPQFLQRGGGCGLIQRSQRPLAD